MPDGSPSSVSTDTFRAHLARAARRGRLDRLATASSKIAWSLAVAFLLVLLLSLATPLAQWALETTLVLLILGLAAAALIYRARLDRHRLLTKMDAHAKLPDAILSTGDWENLEPDAWREGQRRTTLRALEQIDWRTAWPVTWPRLLWLPLASALLLALVIGFVQEHWRGEHRAAEIALAKQNAPVPPAELKPLEEVFKDWDAAQKIAPSPELAKLLKDLQPMREQMAAGKMNEKQLLLKLNEVQAQLQAQQQKLDASSLEPLAATMADAVRNLDGMSATAAALERKDFAAAAQQAGSAEQKYSSGETKMPESANAQASADKLNNAAQQASNNPSASNAMRQMQGALGQKSGSQMSKGLGNLKNSFAQESARQSQSHSNNIQMSQLNSFKNGLCDKPGGPGTQAGMPQLSLTHSLQPGKGAGSTVDPNRSGAMTNLDSHTNEMKLTGTAGEGDSQTQTESSNDPHLEQTASGIRAPQFSAYQKMSEQAIDDENLPVADRQAIKRYFEDIRPTTSP